MLVWNSDGRQFALLPVCSTPHSYMLTLFFRSPPKVQAFIFFLSDSIAIFLKVCGLPRGYLKALLRDYHSSFVTSYVR